MKTAIALLPVLFLSASVLAGQESPTAVRAYVTHFGASDISVIDLATRQRIAVITTGARPHGLAISPRGDRVYVSNEADNTVTVVDPRTNTVVAKVPVGTSPNQIAVSANGRWLYVTEHADGTLAILSTESLKVEKRLAVGRNPHIAYVHPGGKAVYITSEGDQKIAIIDSEKMELAGEVLLKAFPRVIAMTPDGQRLFLTIRWLNGALVIDPNAKKVVNRLALDQSYFAPDGADAHGLVVSPDGSRLYVTSQQTHELTEFGLPTLRVLRKVRVGRNPNWIDLTSEGDLGVVSNTDDDSVSIVDLRRFAVVASIPVGREPKRLAVGTVQIGQ